MSFQFQNSAPHDCNFSISVQVQIPSPPHAQGEDHAGEEVGIFVRLWQCPTCRTFSDLFVLGTRFMDADTIPFDGLPENFADCVLERYRNAPFSLSMFTIPPMDPTETLH